MKDALEIFNLVPMSAKRMASYLIQASYISKYSMIYVNHFSVLSSTSALTLEMTNESLSPKRTLFQPVKTVQLPLMPPWTYTNCYDLFSNHGKCRHSIPWCLFASLTRSISCRKMHFLVSYPMTVRWPVLQLCNCFSATHRHMILWIHHYCLTLALTFQ